MTLIQFAKLVSISPVTVNFASWCSVLSFKSSDSFSDPSSLIWSRTSHISNPWYPSWYLSFGLILTILLCMTSLPVYSSSVSLYLSSTLSSFITMSSWRLFLEMWSSASFSLFVTVFSSFRRSKFWSLTFAKESFNWEFFWINWTLSKASHFFKWSSSRFFSRVTSSHFFLSTFSSSSVLFNDTFSISLYPLYCSLSVSNWRSFVGK